MPSCIPNYPGVTLISFIAAVASNNGNFLLHVGKYNTFNTVLTFLMCSLCVCVCVSWCVCVCVCPGVCLGVSWCVCLCLHAIAVHFLKSDFLQYSKSTVDTTLTATQANVHFVFQNCTYSSPSTC